MARIDREMVVGSKSLEDLSFALFFFYLRLLFGALVEELLHPIQLVIL